MRPGNIQGTSFIHLRLMLLFAIISAVWTTVLPGQTDEGFEGIQRTWTIHGQSRDFRLIQHERSRQEKFAGLQSEHFHFQFRSGDQTRLVHSISPSQVIYDFCPSVAVKSSAQRVQLSVRVVFPKTGNPVGKGPLTVLVPLAVTESIDSWEVLKANDGDVVRQLARRLRSIQSKHTNLKVDQADAYCDLVVLDGFTDPAPRVKIWIDELKVKGYLPRREESFSLAQPDTQLKPSMDSIRVRDTCLTVNDKPVFLRILEYQSESLELVKQLGFNTILLKKFPSNEQVHQCRQFGIWILSPPPETTEQLALAGRTEIILAWNLGEGLTSHQFFNTKNASTRIRQNDPKKRPLFCHAFFPVKKFEQQVDFLRHQSKSFSQAREVWAKEFESGKQSSGRPFLVDIATQFSLPVRLQNEQVSSRQLSGVLPATEIDNQIYQAITSGARGLVFRSEASLQTDNLTNAELIPLIQKVNWELQQIEPWIAGGTLNRSAQNNNLTALFALDRSQLAWIKKGTRARQPHRRTPTELPLRQKSPRVYQVDLAGITPVQYRTNNGAIQFDLKPHSKFQKILIASDPLTIEFVQKTTDRFPNNGLLRASVLLAQSRHDSVFGLVDELSRMNLRNPVVYASLTEAGKSLRQIDSFLKNRRMTSALALLQSVNQQLDSIENAIKVGSTSQSEEYSSPFIKETRYLGNHIRWQRTLEMNSWSPNHLTDAPLRSMRQLADAGWKLHLNETSGMQASVRLVNGAKPQPDRASVKALRMESWSTSDRSERIDVSPIWVSLPKLKIEKGNVVRIEAAVRIDSPIRNSNDGFLITDSFGGNQLALRLQSTNGWQSVVIDRVVTDERMLQITLALTGLGTVDVRDFSVRTMRFETGSEVSKVGSTPPFE